MTNFLCPKILKDANLDDAVFFGYSYINIYILTFMSINIQALIYFTA